MKLILLIIIGFLPLVGQTQEQFILSLDEFQSVENADTSMQSQMRFPMSEKVIVMGGLDHLDEIGKYFNVYGSKLRVDDLSMDIDGTHKVILRREDGKNFFDLFPKVTARLIPLTHMKWQKEIHPQTLGNSGE